jgi:hypothetical protein
MAKPVDTLASVRVGNKWVHILPYDVVQITRDNGATWHDYASIKDASDAQHAIGLVRHGMLGIPGKPFRIVRGQAGRGIILA